MQLALLSGFTKESFPFLLEKDVNQKDYCICNVSKAFIDMQTISGT
jgi:hypothetical protein